MFLHGVPCKFINRRESQVLFCFTVCDYFTHEECKEFSVSDCKKCASYTPYMQKVIKMLLDVKFTCFCLMVEGDVARRGLVKHLLTL